MDSSYEAWAWGRDHNHTWEVVDLSSGKVPIGFKYVFKVKYHADETVERFKVR